MNKNLKILSTVAAVGILTTAGLMGTTNAASGRSLGVYRKLSLANGKTVVPYVLESNLASITSKEVADEFGITIVGNAKTGTTFTKGTETHHVVVYGDVNKSGTLTVADVSALASGIANGTLEDVQKVAGDVTQNNSLTVADVTTLANAIVNNQKLNVSLTPEEVKTEYAYTLKVNDNNVVNNQNGTTVKVSVKSDKVFDEANKVLRLQLVDANGNAVTTVAKLNKDVDVTINKHSNYTEVTGITFASVTTDGKYTIELLEAENEAAATKVYSKKVGEVEVELNREEPVVAKVSAARTNTRNATVSLTNIGKNSLTKMYYLVAESGDTAPTTLEELTSSMTLNANGVTNAVIATDLVEGSAYDLYYVIEDTYGNQSEISEAVVVPSDKATKAVAVEKDGFTLPKLDGSADSFGWTLKDIAASTTFKVVLYKDGTAVAEEEVTAANVAASVKDFTAEMTEIGKYKIGVTVKGDGTATSDSDEVLSGEVEVKALKDVTDVVFTVKKVGNTSTKVLSWKNANKAEEFSNYTIKLYELNETTGKYGTPTDIAVAQNGVTVTEGVTELTLTDSQVADNKVYKAEVVVNPLATQKAVVGSTPVASEGFFVIGNLSASSVVANSDTSMTITLASEVSINKQPATYKVEIHEQVVGTDSMGRPTTSSVLVRTDDVTIKDKQIVVNNLKANTGYSFKVIATVSGIQGESGYTTAATTLKTTPELKNLVNVATADEAKAGTIFVSGNNVTINGAEPIDATANYSTEFQNAIALVKTLLPGDTVTVDGTTVTLKLARINNGTLALGTTAKDLTVVIEGNDYERTISTTAGSEPTEVVLKGTGALFNVAGLNSKKITLNPGVDVVGTKVYTVSANTENTATVINGVKIATAKETVVEATTNAASGKELVVTVNESANDLVFENTAGRNVTTQIATIKFKGKDNLTASQTGSIVIKTTGGKVTVAQENANVSSTITVEVNKGEVDLKDVALTGKQNVTVNNTAEADVTTVTVKSATPAPIAMTNVVVKDYSKMELSEVQSAVPGTTAENLEKVVEYINSFGIEDGKATITVANINKPTEVKLVFTGIVNDTIEGLQK